MTGELKQGPTLADTKGRRRIQKLDERCRHVDEQIAELKDKKRLMQCEAWCERAQLTRNPLWRLVCWIMQQWCR